MLSKRFVVGILGILLAIGSAYAGPGDDLKDSPITPEQVAQIQAAVERIRNAAKAEIPPETIGSPDTAVARAALQTEIVSDITFYLQTLSDIDTELRTYFSRIIALKNDADLNPKDGVKALLLQNELKRTVPIVNASINKKYQSALSALYLNFRYPVLVRSRYNEKKSHKAYFWFQNGLKVKNSFAYVHPAPVYGSPYTAYTALSLARVQSLEFPGCVTGACVYALSDMLRDWFEVVDGLNQQIDIAKFGLKVDFGSKTATPFLALAMVDSAERMLKDPNKNVSYALGAYLGELLVNRAGGVVVGLSAAPALLLEKVGRVAEKIFTAPTIDLRLALDHQDYYGSKEIRSAIAANAEAFAPTIPAVLYGQEIIDYQKSPARAKVAAYPAVEP